jgi:hypothetical protein
MSNALALVNDAKKIKPARQVKIWREHPVTEDVIFKGTDESGRSGWFLRLMVTGLYPRRVGPYRTKEQAIEVLEEFIASVQVETLCDLENDQTVNQAYVVEGVPRLVGSGAELQENV